MNIDNKRMNKPIKAEVVVGSHSLMRHIRQMTSLMTSKCKRVKFVPEVIILLFLPVIVFRTLVSAHALQPLRSKPKAQQSFWRCNIKSWDFEYYFLFYFRFKLLKMTR